VRIQIFVDSLDTWTAVNASVIGRKLRDIRPASTALIAGFIDPRIKIEIEVTAKRRAG
jgi:enamine deaminase RidA (YjgF/YER057c/UK114 family)